MKTILLFLLGITLAGSAQATIYTDNNPADVWLTDLTPSYTGTFTLTGYNPATEVVDWANTSFTFWDLVGKESFTLNMGGDLLSNGSFSGWLITPLGVVNGMADLSADGVLSYTVTKTSGFLTEFWLKNASIEASTSARNVPDASGTALLLGLGLIVTLAGVRRQIAR